MNYVDRTLIALADPASRAGVFDQDALAQVVGAAYDVAAMGITGAYTPLFDDLTLAVTPTPDGTAEGSWAAAGSAETTYARFRLSGLGDDSTARVEAVWRGSIVARFSASHERITDVVTNWPSLDAVDETVKAAHGGALPTDAATLESDRRDALVTLLGATLDQPAAVDDQQLEEWLAGTGTSSVGELLERDEGVVAPATATLTFSPPAEVSETPRALPIAAALLVRDTPFSLADLLALSSVVRERLRAVGVERPADATLKLLRPVIVVWVVPKETFDDTDWPGADRDARRAAAGTWLAREGIGLAVT